MPGPSRSFMNVSNFSGDSQTSMTLMPPSAKYATWNSAPSGWSFSHRTSPRSWSYCSSVIPSQRIFMTLAIRPSLYGSVHLRPERRRGSTLWGNSRVPVSNDHLHLVPRVAWQGAALRFDWPGLRIRIAAYEEGASGRTVFQFLPARAPRAPHVRAGSPGQLGGFDWVHAICLAGGSLYGLEAATGVAAEILAQRGHEVGWTNIPNVSGAIVYDFGRRETTVYPDKALGRAALTAAREGVFPLGARGAGRSVSVGKTFGLERGEPGGQGAAFRQAGATKVAVFTVVNAVGAIVDREGRVVRGHLTPAGERTPLLEGVTERLVELA